MPLIRKTLLNNFFFKKNLFHWNIGLCDNRNWILVISSLKYFCFTCTINTWKMGCDWVLVVSFCIWVTVLTIYRNSILWPLWSVSTTYEASEQFTLYNLWSELKVYPMRLMKRVDSLPYITYEVSGQFTLCHL